MFFLEKRENFIKGGEIKKIDLFWILINYYIKNIFSFSLEVGEFTPLSDQMIPY